MSIVNASDTSCWEWKWTVPTTTYASGVIYWCDGDIPIITIYWDDGKWITIKAMNEWASAISSQDDTNSFWKIYQRGNNYPFPSPAEWIDPNFTDGFVSAEWYGPWTENGYYYSDKYMINASGIWDTSNNMNLRWGSWDKELENNIVWIAIKIGEEALILQQ